MSQHIVDVYVAWAEDKLTQFPLDCYPDNSSLQLSPDRSRRVCWMLIRTVSRTMAPPEQNYVLLDGDFSHFSLNRFMCI